MKIWSSILRPLLCLCKVIPGVHLYEHTFSLAKWIPDSFGTSDAVVIDEANKRHIIDLKYGKGVSVEAEQNTSNAICFGCHDDLGLCMSLIR